MDHLSPSADAKAEGNFANSNLPSCASKQPILVGQVVYPKTIGKNNGCESLYPEQFDLYQSLM